MSIESRDEAPTKGASSDGGRGNLAKYNFVDALRGIAILGVMLVHVHQNFPTDFGVKFIGLGQYGVMLFYVVSAFSLTLSLLSRTKSEHSPILNYTIRRFFRIAPLFYLAVVLYLLRPYIFPLGSFPVDLSHSNFSIQPFDVLLTIAFLNGWYYKTINLIVPGGWSVAVETNFYIVLPFLFAYAKDLKKAIALLVLAILVGKVCTKLLYLAVAPGFAPSELIHLGIFAGMWLPNQMSIFVLGLIFCNLFLSNSQTIFHRVLNNTYFLILLLYALLLIFASISTETLEKYVSIDHFALVFIFLFCLLMSRKPSKLFVNCAFIYIGRISYSMYLLHFLSIQIAICIKNALVSRGYEISFFLAFPFVLAITAIIATITYRMIEVPGQKLGGRIIKHMNS